MAKTLYIIDGHAHIYAAYYAPMRQRLVSPAGEDTKATYIFTNMLLSLLENQRPDMLLVAMDSKTPSFRAKIYPDYKAHRPPMPDDMPVQIARIEQILGAMKVPVIRLDGFEADDVIGTVAKRASAEGIDVYICSKDKDMLQLLDEHTNIFDVKNGGVTTKESMYEKTAITPQQFLDVLALAGDTADNIPGVPDVGPKTALSWIQKFGSLENLYKNEDSIKGKRGESLRNSKDLLTLSRELVTINCDSPIEFNCSDFVVRESDRNELSGIFTELGFNRLLGQLGLTENSDTSQSAHMHYEGPDSAKTVEHDYQLIDTQEKFDKFLAKLKSEKLFAVDTETTDINPMKAELVGMSFSWQRHQAFYLPVRVPMGQKCLDIDMVRDALGPVLADERIKKIGQNIKYDIIVLHNAKMPLKGIHFDTMVASYCLDAGRMSHSMDNMAADYLNYHCIPLSALIGKGKNQLIFDMIDTETACEYAAEDGDITFALYEYLSAQLKEQPGINKLFEQVEMPLVCVLAQMEINGVSLDVKLLKKMSIRLADDIEGIVSQIYSYSGVPFNIDSPKQLAGVLFDRLGLRPIRVGKAGRSTDAAVLEKLTAEHPIADLLLQYRTLRKLQNTYVDKLGTLINPKTNRVHASFNQTITATGRLSSSKPNLQNIPIRSEIGKQIRAAFVAADKSDCILSADYSQIELRLLAHFSKDRVLLDAFAADQDIHRFVASQVYNIPVEEVTEQMRSHAKAVNFGIIYGQGAYGLSRSIGISISQAKEFIDDYFARYSSIRKFMDDVINSAGENGYVETILHRRRRIVNINNKNKGKQSQAQRLAVNTVIQGSAADLIKVAMINIQRKIDTENLPVKMTLQIHDELVFELPEKQAHVHSKWIIEQMTGAIALDVPLKVDISIGPNWLKS